MTPAVVTVGLTGSGRRRRVNPPDHDELAAMGRNDPGTPGGFHLSVDPRLTDDGLDGSSSVLRALAVAVAAVCVALLVVFVTVAVAAHDARNLPGNVTVFVAAIAVGCLLASRLPKLPIGWLLLSAVLVAMLTNAARTYLLLDYRFHDGRLALGSAAIVIAFGLSFIPTIFLGAAIMLLPDGRTPSPRWRWVSWTDWSLALIFLVGGLVGGAGILGQRIHLDQSGLPTNTPTGIYGIFGDTFVLAFGLVAIWIAWIVYQVGNFRRSSGTRRQQMKWLVAGGLVSALCVVVGDSLRTAGTVGDVFFQLSRVGIAAFPVAIAVAVFKYRLFDLGRILSRTVSYALVTAVVVGVYVGIVTLTTKALGFSSPVAVAASTLLAVAVFNPARRRLQRVVDRHFNRARYDAERTVDAYRARLRDVVDPVVVQGELLDVVRATVAPSHSTLWLNRPEQP